MPYSPATITLQQILREPAFALLLVTHRIFNQNIMCRLFDLLAFVDISLPHSYYFPNKLCLGFVFQALMENPKLCHDKSKHSYMLNIFCFPLLCCQCLGVKKGLRRLSVETVVEVGCSQSLELWVTAAAGSLLPQSIHMDSISKISPELTNAATPVWVSCRKGCSSMKQI